MGRGGGFVSLLGAVAREAARAQRQSDADRRRGARLVIQAEREAARQQRYLAQLDKQRARDEREQHLASRQEEIEEKNTALQETLTDLANILPHTLQVDDRISFDSLRMKDEYQKYATAKNLVQDPRVPIKIAPVQPGFFARLIPGSMGRYRQAVQQAEHQFDGDTMAYQQQISELTRARAKDRTEYDRSRAQFSERVRVRNAEVDQLETLYASGDRLATVTYNQMVLERSEYPEGFPQTFRVAYADDSKELVVDYDLPTREIVPSVEEYRYVKSKDLVEEKARKSNDLKARYQDVVASTALRTVHELFEADQHGHVQTVVFNGFVSAVDPATGRDIRPCLISVRATKDRFLEVDLARVERLICLRNLGAQVSPRPDEMVAVKPVVEFDMVDKRFVDQADVLSDLDSRPNLMDLNPFEFENLVSNLFTKMGLETKQTRSSRDGGVDAVAFDMRPVLGGKVVIQAKRYKNTVGVSAVRDLYGTMLNEGANKGILVCTSHYGADAYEFAKDKPIELIDGGGLLYLLDQVGTKAKIIFPAE